VLANEDHVTRPQLALPLPFNLHAIDERPGQAIEVFNPVLPPFQPDARVPPRHGKVWRQVEVYRGRWEAAADEEYFAEILFYLSAHASENYLHAGLPLTKGVAFRPKRVTCSPNINIIAKKSSWDRPTPQEVAVTMKAEFSTKAA
jgi:hypothetical protein